MRVKHFRQFILSIALVACLHAYVQAEGSAAGLGPATSSTGVADTATGATLQPANPQSLQSSAADTLMAPTPSDGVSNLQVQSDQSATATYLKGEADTGSRQSPADDRMPLSDVIAWLELGVVVLACVYIFLESHAKTSHLRHYYRPEHKHPL